MLSSRARTQTSLYLYVTVYDCSLCIGVLHGIDTFLSLKIKSFVLAESIIEYILGTLPLLCCHYQTFLSMAIIYCYSFSMCIVHYLNTNVNRKLQEYMPCRIICINAKLVSISIVVISYLYYSTTQNQSLVTLLYWMITIPIP